MKSSILFSAVLAVGFAAMPASTFAQKASEAEKTAALQERLKVGIEKKKMEQSALENDPKVIAAKDKLEQADKAWAALQAQVDEEVKSDEDYKKAAEAYKAADEKLTAAKKTLADASRSAAKAREDQARSRAQSAQSSSGSGSGGQTYQPRSTTGGRSTAPVNPLASQQKAVKDAQEEVNKARTDMTKARTKVARGMESKDDWKAAKAAREKASGEYDAAAKPVREALKTKPEFLALLRQEADAQAILGE